MKTNQVLSIIFAFASALSVSAQKEAVTLRKPYMCHLPIPSSATETQFVDNAPKYTLSENYQTQAMVSKVVYTATETIVYHSYLADYGGGVYYLGIPELQERWVLQNKENLEEVFPLTEIRNIRKNGVLLKESLKDEMSVYYDSAEKDVFTCEVHFPRLPKHVKVVDLLEGLTLSDHSHRFHAFNLQLKPRPEPVVVKAPIVVAKAPIVVQVPKVPVLVDAKKAPVETDATDVNAPQVSVYPNPAQDKIFIKFNKNQDLRIDVLDALGRVKAANTATEITVKDWQRGIYFVQCVGKQGTFIKKVVLE